MKAIPPLSPLIKGGASSGGSLDFDPVKLTDQLTTDIFPAEIGY